MIVKYLNEDGFEASAVHDGLSALEQVQSTRFDAMILDVMMPGISGQDVLRKLQASGHERPPLAVLMLTARGEEIDRVVGLETGADDYLPKPCSLRELAARLRAILRRARPNGFAPGKVLTVGDLSVDESELTAKRDGKLLPLTGAEFSVLRTLMASSGYPVSKEHLTRTALGRKYLPDDRSIDVHIANLRKKLSDPGGADGYIRTIRGTGYLLVNRTGS